jgi:uncharacterized membrane protein (Fun14 family)
MEEIIFALKSGGISLISGIAVGFISKKVSKILVFFVAVAFILIQIAIYNGYLEVDWFSWGNKAVDLVKDVDIQTNSLKELIVRNAPFAVAALIGFIFGFKKG